MQHGDGGQSFETAFGERVRKARDDKQWSQRRLAEKLREMGLKIDPSAVTRIERGSREVKLREAVAIAIALRVPLQDLAAPPGTSPRTRLEEYLDAVDERRSAGRSAFAGMAIHYALLVNLFDEHPELLEESGEPEGFDTEKYLAMEAHRVGEEARSVVHLALDDKQFELVQAIIAASVTNLISKLDEEDFDELDEEDFGDSDT